MSPQFSTAGGAARRNDSARATALESTSSLLRTNAGCTALGPPALSGNERVLKAVELSPTAATRHQGDPHPSRSCRISRASLGFPSHSSRHAAQSSPTVSRVNRKSVYVSVTAQLPSSRGFNTAALITSWSAFKGERSRGTINGPAMTANKAIHIYENQTVQRTLGGSRVGGTVAEPIPSGRLRPPCQCGGRCPTLGA